MNRIFEMFDVPLIQSPEKLNLVLPGTGNWSILKVSKYPSSENGLAMVIVFGLPLWM